MEYLQTESSESECSRMSYEDCSEYHMEGKAAPQGCPVTLHLLADPGHGSRMQREVGAVLQTLAPPLAPPEVLVWVSERELPRDPPPATGPPLAQSALAVVLFLREEEEEEAEQLTESRALRQLRVHLSLPPWQYHHTECLALPRQRIRPYHPADQRFYSLGRTRDLPLWAVRQVHYGPEVVRYTLYCRHTSFSRSATLYTAVLGQGPSLEREGFVCFTLFRPRLGFEVQLALKRLPPGVNPVRLSSSILEFRISDLRPLRPHLPHPCISISALRWQTRDHDGNKILLQVREYSAGDCWNSHVFPSLRPFSPDSLLVSSRQHASFPDSDIPSVQYPNCRCRTEGAIRPLRDSPSSPEVLSGLSFTSSSSLSSGSLGSPSSSSVSPHLEKNFSQLPPLSNKPAPQICYLPQGHHKQLSPRLPEGLSASRRTLPSATGFQPILEQNMASTCPSPSYHTDEFYI